MNCKSEVFDTTHLCLMENMRISLLVLKNVQLLVKLFQVWAGDSMANHQDVANNGQQFTDT